VKIISLETPSSVQLGQPFEIRPKARNNGPDANQGYFSVSFPDGVEHLAIQSNADKKIGLEGESSGNERWVLSYPIAEGHRYGEGPTRPAGKEYFINVQGYPKRKGLLWFYVNASCYDGSLKDRRRDAPNAILDKDQRDEDVYCGTIEVL
jgi:hypothetical protein